MHLFITLDNKIKSFIKYDFQLPNIPKKWFFIHFTFGRWKKKFQSIFHLPFLTKFCIILLCIWKETMDLYYVIKSNPLNYSLKSQQKKIHQNIDQIYSKSDKFQDESKINPWFTSKKYKSFAEMSFYIQRWSFEKMVIFLVPNMILI